MSDPVATIRGAVTSLTPIAWPSLVAAIAEVSEAPSPEAEQALVDLLTSQSVMSFAGGYVPHSQSPLDMIRAAAIDTLGRWTGNKHADAFRQAAAATSSPIVKRMAAKFSG
jgi:hypothetical protein